LKVETTIFFYCPRIAHKFVPAEQVVNQVYYLKFWGCVECSAKKPEMWTAGRRYLQKDNAQAHTALRVLGKAFESCPPYSLSPFT
jgi:hypothetical protein